MIIKQIEHKEIDNYIRSGQELGSVFNSGEWINMYGKNLKIYGIFDKAGLLTGGFQLYQVKKYGMNYYRNPPFSPHIGLFFQNKSQNKAKYQSTIKNTLTLISKFLRGLPYQVLSVALPPYCLDVQPFIWDKFKVVPFYTYRIDLAHSMEEIRNEMLPERRNDINKAIKDNVFTKLTNNYEIVGKLVKNTFERQSKSVDEYHLEKILYQFANPNNSFGFVSYINDKPVSTCFCIYDKQTVYYLLGGYDSSNKHKGAGALAIWKSIEYAKELKRAYFDFEGSMVQQIERYFRGFGGELTPYFTLNKALLPVEILLKFIKRELY